MNDPYPSSASEDDADLSARVSEIRRLACCRSKLQQIAKTRNTMATLESKQKRSNIGKKQALRARERELELAKQIYVAYEPSKKKRALLRAKSTIFGLRQNPILFMADRTGLKIFRVSKDGDLKPRELVGPCSDDANLFPHGLPEQLLD